MTIAAMVVLGPLCLFNYRFTRGVGWVNRASYAVCGVSVALFAAADAAANPALAGALVNGAWLVIVAAAVGVFWLLRRRLRLDRIPMRFVWPQARRKRRYAHYTRRRVR